MFSAVSGSAASVAPTSTIENQYIGTLSHYPSAADSHPMLWALRTSHEYNNTGYRSLSAAERAVGFLTKGDDTGGAAIFQRDGRYFAAGLLGKHLDDAWAPADNGWAPAKFEGLDDAKLTTQKYVDSLGIREIVDGATSVRFDSVR